MSSAKPKAGRSSGLYAREIRMSLRNNSGAFGYSVMITCALAMTSAQHSSPGVGQIFLFALGTVVSFLVVETSATSLFRRSLGSEEHTTVVALGSSIGFVSIGFALGAIWVAGALLPETLAWVVGSFVASTTYLLANAVEMSVARKVEEARDLA